MGEIAVEVARKTTAVHDDPGCIGSGVEVAEIERRIGYSGVIGFGPTSGKRPFSSTIEVFTKEWSRECVIDVKPNRKRILIGRIRSCAPGIAISELVSMSG